MVWSRLKNAVHPMWHRFRAYNKKLFSERYLLYTNIAISAGLSMTGDVLQQRYQLSKKNMKVYNKRRTLHVTCSGFLIGPLVHYWYLFLDKWYPGRTWPMMMSKLLLDQLICSPIYIGIFLVSLGVLEGDSWKTIRADFLQKGKILYTAELVVWPPAQFVNFYFLPTKFRVLYDNVISLCFDIYWSYIRYDHMTDADDTVQKLKDTSS